MTDSEASLRYKRILQNYNELQAVAEQRLDELRHVKKHARDSEQAVRRLTYENEKLLSEKQSYLANIAELNESLVVYRENFKLCQ